MAMGPTLRAAKYGKLGAGLEGKMIIILKPYMYKAATLRV